MLRLVFALFFSLLPAVLWAEKVALVIGNASYQNVAPLANPGRDAEAVSAALSKQGFDVVKATDLTRSALYNTLRDFRDRADRADVAMVYYAGHGIEVGGQNFLIPVDARLSDERDADLEMIGMDVVLRQLSGAKKLKMVVLDACRDNPFVQKMQRENRGRNIGQGLAIVSNAEAATLIAYAAAAGEVTPDGPAGHNSPFTSAFLKALDLPPADVRILLGAVRDELNRTVPGAVPFVYSSLGAEQVVINPNSTKPEPPAPVTTEKPVVHDEEQMLRDYAMAEFSGSVEAWDAFLETHASQSSQLLYLLAQRTRAQLAGQKIAALPPQTGTAERATDPAPVTTSVAPPAGEQQQAAVQIPAIPVPEPQPAPQPQAPALSRDELKRAVQAALKDRGCYRSSVDGIWGRGSLAALVRFNEAAGTDLHLDSNADAEVFAAVLKVVEQSEEVICAAAQPTPKPARKTTTARKPSTTSTATVQQAAPDPTPPKPAVKSGAPTCRPKYGTLYGSDGSLSVGLPICR
ncbi:caspase family protein [Ruegeria sp. WL0004]|uniref:Caspase family protein n=1 Tax=Ruegeria marisflavi TaxID=2984152 RepID=A0ABT2WUC9_9RHOB|nr:caspase family protein [Ruegeria sp. WL0004]MCU9839507.1 caspase family protein [Ruegeria sp. WL0004]